MTCNICQGTRTIRCATFDEPSVSLLGPEFVPEPYLNPGFEEFPCPKCGPLRVPVQRLAAIKAIGTVREEFGKDAGYVDHIRANLAAKIGMELLKNGHLEFETQIDQYNGNTMMRATAYIADAKLGREGIERAKRDNVRRLKTPTSDPRKMKIKIEFESDVNKLNMPARVTVDGTEFDAVVIDCSVRTDQRDDDRYLDPASMRYVYSTQATEIDLSVDLKCRPRMSLPPEVSNAPRPVKPKPKPEARDPFKREIDFE
jgi:hypothetical protein